MNFKQHLALQIRFNDIDIMGHVNNAVYPGFFDLGRISYFDKVFGASIPWSERGLIIASIKTDFFIPIFLNDKVEILTRIVRVGNKSFEMFQQVRAVESGEVKCEAFTVMVCFDFVKNESVIISDEWRNKIKAFEDF